MDGRTLPEMKIAEQQAATMSAGLDAFGQPATVIRFEFDDGTPYPQTVTFPDGTTATASDWKLIVDPADPDRVKWVPVP